MFFCRLSIPSSGRVGEGAARQNVVRVKIVKAMRCIVSLCWELTCR